MLKPALPALALLLLSGAEAPAPADLLRDYARAPSEEGLGRLLALDLPVERWLEEIRALRPTAGKEETDRIELRLPCGKSTFALVRIPPDYHPDRPWPLLVVAPGTHCGAELSLQWWRAAPEAGFLLACTQSLAVDDAWTFSPEEREIPLAAIREMKLRFHVDEDRVFLGGMSKGGHASWDLGFRFPHLFAGIVPECGRLFNHGLIATEGFDYLENGLGLPAYHLQGALDDPPLVASIRAACAELKRRGADVTYVEFPDRGHVPSTDQYPAALEWMGKHVRPAPPRRTFCRTHDLRYGRRDWTRILEFDGEVLGENPRKLTLKGPPAKDAEGRDRDKRRHMLEHSALLEAEISGPNEVRAKTRHVKAFSVLPGPGMFDLSKPVRILVNGKKAFEGVVTPSSRTLLERFGQDLDRRRPVLAEIQVEVP